MADRKEIFALLILLTQLKFTLLQSDYCQWSVETAEIVLSCPETEEDNAKASKRKDCEKIAFLQNCSDPSEFKYHCVIDHSAQNILEVCAPSKIILGFCAEFNERGGIIQNHHDAKCTTFQPPCKRRYSSTDSYKYLPCYDLVKKTRITSPSTVKVTTGNITTTHSMTEKSSSNTVLNIVLGICLPVFFLCTISCFNRKRLMKIIRQRTQHTGDRNPSNIEEVQREIGGALQQKNTPAASDNMLREEDPLLTDELEAGDKENEGSHSDEISLVSADSISDLIAALRAELLNKMQRTEAPEPRKITTKDIKRETFECLQANSLLDKYFVETEYYRKAKSTLDEKGVAILTGPPGCGKTSTAIHLMKDSFYATWKIQKINSSSDFGFLDLQSSTLIFIDNIFDDHASMQDVNKWWDQFTKLLLTCKKKSEKSEVRVCILVTAKENVIQKACENSNRKSFVFKAEHIIDAKILQLSDREKEEILKKQIDYAYEQKGIEKPIHDVQLLEKIRKQPQGPIGFSLCANLYACEKECRKYGGDFFFLPMFFFKSHIQTLIKSDFTGKIKPLLLLLFLQETCKNQMPEFVNLRNEEDCRQFFKNLKQISPQKLLSILFFYDPENCKPYEKWLADLAMEDYNFSSLATEAEKLTTCLLENSQGEGCYVFRHRSIFDAVGSYFLAEEFHIAIRTFPIEAFERQDFYGLSEEQSLVLASRFIYEIQVGNSSKVCTCNGLKSSDLVVRLTKLLTSLDAKYLRNLLAIPDANSSLAPLTFWITKNKLYTFSELILDMIIVKNIDVKFHLSVSLLGDCCESTENAFQNLDVQTSTVELAWKSAVEFRDGKSNSVLHLIVISDRKDSYVCKIFRNLVELETENHCEIWNSKNTDGETILNLAAKCRHSSRVLSMLSLFEIESIDANTTDSNGCTPVHKSVSALLDNEYNVSKELEALVRLSVLMIYGADPDQRNKNEERAVDFCSNSKYSNVHEMLYTASGNEDAMIRIIEKSLKALGAIDDDRVVIVPNPRNRLSQRMLAALQTSVQYLESVNFSRGGESVLNQ